MTTPGRDWPDAWVKARLGYRPADSALFAAALTHRSAAGPNNERLEFLGDAVVNLVVAERLYRQFPEADEGDLSRLRARLVSAGPLAGIAQELGLGEAMRLGSGELKTGGFRRESILADGFEALCAALYLDGGLEAVRCALELLMTPRLDALPDAGMLKDAKTRLQELLQARGLPLPAYVIRGVTGEPHEQVFEVSCAVEVLGEEAHGRGSSRRRAEQEAAQCLLERLERSTARDA